MGHFGVIDGESTYKRDSVIRPLTDPDGWPSIYAVYLGRLGGPPSHVLTLLQVGFAEPPGSPRALVRSCRTVSPLPVVGPLTTTTPIGGLFSVALSCGSPRLAVSQHPALRSPDFPRPGQTPGRDHPANSPSLPVWRMQPES